MKITQQQQQEAQGFMNSIIAKSWEDPTFKQNLVKSPVQTIEAFTGKPLNLPEGVKLVVNDQTDPSYLHVNIPAKANIDDFELTDEQLETVAGGEIGFTCFLGGVALGVALVALYNDTH